MIGTPSAEMIAINLAARRNGKGWRARCPAHEDKNPSLDIDVGESGKPLLICRAGCTNDAVIDALRSRGAWPEAREWTPPKPLAQKHNGNGHAANGHRANGHSVNGAIQASPASALRHPKLGEPHHRFDYFNADGGFIGSICRWDSGSGKKDIRPARWTGSGWEWRGFDEPHPLYNLPDLTANPARPVLVVEGEKTADAARHLVGDLSVTTWPHGAQAVAKADWKPLQGRDVVLWQDNDEPGAKAMRDVGTCLRSIGARSIRLVKLPSGLPDGWDLADEIPEGLDPVALITEARDIAADRVAALSIVNCADLLSREFKPPRWAIPDLVPEGLSILAGKPKTGKSWLALDFALSVAAGGLSCGDIRCQQGAALLIALEDTERRLHGRIRGVLQGQSAPAALSIAVTWRRADEGGLDDLRAWLSMNRNARLVVIDTLQKIRGAKPRDAGVYADDYRAIADIKRLADEFTVPIVLVHHTNKEGNSDPLMAVSGTAGITGSADTILVLDRNPNDPNALLYVRGRDVNEAEMAIQFDGQTGKWLRLGTGADWRISEERRAIIRALKDGGAMSPKDIAETIGKKGGAVRRLLLKMVKDGGVIQHTDGRYAAP